MKQLYIAAVGHIYRAKGQTLNVCDDIENSLSISELLILIEQIAKVKLRYDELFVRARNQRKFITNPTKAKQLEDRQTSVGAEEGILRIDKWVSSPT